MSPRKARKARPSSPAAPAPRGRSAPLLTYLPFVILAACLVLAVTTSLRNSVTVDEVGNLPRGLWIWHYGDFRLDSETTPLPMMLAAAPVALTEHLVFSQQPDPQLTSFAIGDRFMHDNAPRYEHDVNLARLVTIVVLLIACAATWRLAHRLYGPAGGAIALIVLAFWPDMIAHGTLVTADVYLAAAMVCAMWALDALLREPDWRQACALGVAIGAATLSKLTGVLLFALVPLAVGLIALCHRLGLGRGDLPPVTRRLLMQLALALAVALVTINLGYGNLRSFQTLGAYHFAAPMMAHVQAWLPHWAPVPLPVHFVHGADLQLSTGKYEAYLSGQFNSSGFWNYYLVGLLVKTPEPILLLWLLSWVLVRRISLREIPMLVVGLGCFAFVSFVSRKNLGVRYVLFVLPLVAVWIGRVTTAGLAARMKAIVGAAAAVACAWLVVATFAAWPHYLAYFNMASGGPDRGHDYLLDSNLDWGQDLITLRDYMQANGIPEIDLAYFGRADPELIYGIKFRPMWEGIQHRYLAVSANFLWGRGYWVYGTEKWMDRDRYAALRNRQPVAVLGHTLYVYDAATLR